MSGLGKIGVSAQILKRCAPHPCPSPKGRGEQPDAPIEDGLEREEAKRRDKIARWVITLGGVTVIASVIAILALIVGITLPLFRVPRAIAIATCRLPTEESADNASRVGQASAAPTRAPPRIATCSKIRAGLASLDPLSP